MQDRYLIAADLTHRLGRPATEAEIDADVQRVNNHYADVFRVALHRGLTAQRLNEELRQANAAGRAR